jgi:hypothetical protein
MQTNAQISDLILRLNKLGESRKASSDGRGAYLGTGSAFQEPFRSKDLSDLLTELLAWRTQVESFSYNPETGLVLYEEKE